MDELTSRLLQRDERALDDIMSVHGRLLSSIAWNITGDRRDAQEIVNDTLLAAWRCIPPDKPNHLAAYLGKIARNKALDNLKKRRAARRGHGQLLEVLEELSAVLSDHQTPDDALAQQELSDAINEFLMNLPPVPRTVFLQRYWFCYPIKDIAADQDTSVSQIKSQLSRLRMKLRMTLQKKGILL